MSYAFGTSYRSTLVMLLSIAAGLLTLVTGMHILRSNAAAYPEPEIISYTATPAIAKPGEKVTLAWSARNAKVCKLSDTLVSTFPTEAKYTFVPKESKVFTLTCLSENNQATRSLNVMLDPGAAQ
jgi:hypothetical protein